MGVSVVPLIKVPPVAEDHKIVSNPEAVAPVMV